MAELSDAQQQILSNLGNSIAVRMSETFSRIGKRRVEVKVKESKVENYQNYIESLPHFTIIGILGTEASRDQVLVEVNPAVAYYLIDRLAGGEGDLIPLEEKKLTDIERAVFEKFVFTPLIPSWNEIWEGVAGPEFKFNLIRVENDPFLTRRMEGEFLHLIMECTVEKGGGVLNVCVPHSLISWPSE